MHYSLRAPAVLSEREHRVSHVASRETGLGPAGYQGALSNWLGHDRAGRDN